MIYQYVEDYLKSELTFGFELEAWAETHDLHKDFEIFAENYFKSQVNEKTKNIDMKTIGMHGDITIDPNAYRCKICYDSGEMPCRECDGDGVVENPMDPNGPTIKCEACNGHGSVDCSECDGSEYTPRPFEWTSPIFKITPQNISLVYKFLYTAVTEKKISTNKSCGFHIHIGFPDLYNVVENRIWILLHLSQNPLMVNTLKEYNGYELENSEYASFDTIEEMEIMLKRSISDPANMYNALKGFVSDTKYVVLRQHPQGTMEWRGPRAFLDKKHLSDIRGFFKDVFLPFSKYIVNAINAESIVVNGTRLLKNDLREYIYKHGNKGDISDVQPRKESSKKFDFRQDMSLIPKLYSKFPWLSKVKFQGIMFAHNDMTYVPHRDLIPIFTHGAIFDSTIKDSVFVYNRRITDCQLINIYTMHGTNEIRRCEVSASFVFGCGFYDCKLNIRRSKRNSFSHCSIVNILTDSIEDAYRSNETMIVNVKYMENCILHNCSVNCEESLQTKFQDCSILGGVHNGAIIQQPLHNKISGEFNHCRIDFNTFTYNDILDFESFSIIKSVIELPYYGTIKSPLTVDVKQFLLSLPNIVRIKIYEAGEEKIKSLHAYNRIKSILDDKENVLFKTNTIKYFELTSDAMEVLGVKL